MRLRSCILACTLIVLFTPVLLARNGGETPIRKQLETSFGERYTFRTLNTRNGLSQNDVQDIYQDSRGLVWIATTDGLNRYDGYSFYRYGKDNSGLQSNLMLAIIEDDYGNLYVGTADKGLFVYKYDEDEFYCLNNQVTGNEILSYNVRNLYIDNEGAIWLYNGENHMVQRLTIDEDYQISKLDTYSEEGHQQVAFNSFASVGHEFFAAGPRGVAVFDEQSNSFQSYITLGGGANNLQPVSDDMFFFTRGANVFLFNTYSKVKRVVAKFPESGTLLYKNKKLWMLSNNAIYQAKFNPKTHTVGKIRKIDSYGDLLVRSGLIDRTGALWVGYLKEAIRLYDSNGKPFHHFNNIGNDHILAMLQSDRKHVWIGTEGSGLFYAKRVNDKSLQEITSHFKKKTIYDVEYSETLNKVLVAVEGAAVYAVNPDGTGPQPLISRLKNARVILADGEYLWMGTYHMGLYRYHTGSKQLLRFDVRDGLSSTIVRNLIFDKDKNLWVATAKGLCVIPNDQIHLRNKIEITPVHNTELRDHYVIPMMLDKEGHLWYGTLGDGLCRIDSLRDDMSVTYRQYTKKDGLSSQVIKAIQQDHQGLIWCSTNHGINSLNSLTGEILTYDVSDGLQDYEFNELSGLATSNGRLMFGGVNGLNSFYPSQIKRDSTLAKPCITDFLLFNKSIVGTPLTKTISGTNVIDSRKIKLNHDQNSFTFVFSALHYANPEKNKFYYRLVGEDKNWIEARRGIHEATYTNLSPGHYVFELRASNGDGIWNPKALTIDVRIDPPFWATWYAFVFYTLVFAVVAYYVWSRFKHRMERHHAIRLAQLERQKSQELLEDKTRFFTNISHEFRTPLTLILSPLQELLQDDEIMQNEKWGKAMQVMRHNGNSLMRLINELLNFAKVEKNKLKVNLHYHDFARMSYKLMEQFAFWAKEKGVVLVTKIPDHEISFFFDAHLMEQIIYNLVSNAIKHTPKEGEVTLAVLDKDSEVEIRISDSGAGISPELQQHLFERFFSKTSDASKDVGGTGIGLFLTKNLVEMHDGTINFESEEGQGTTFVVHIPKRILGHQEDAKDNEQVQTDGNTLVAAPVFEEDQDALLEEEPKPCGCCDEDEQPSEPLKLLVVDDAPEICDVLVMLFEKDYQVSRAEDGQEAWDMLDELQPDIIVSDVMMPNMNGLQLCQRVKEDERFSHIPVILLTAKARQHDMAEGFSYDADGYCPKPFENTMLRNMVASILKNRQRVAKRFHKTSKTTEIAQAATTATDQRFLNKLIEYVENNLDRSNLVVDDVCKELGVTSTILNKKLRALLNTTTNAFIRSMRMKRAAQLLATGRYTVSDVTYDVGFNDLKYFRECFKKEFGVLPQKYKEEMGHASDTPVDND